MANSTVKLTSEVPDLKGMELVTQVVDPEIEKFNTWFSDPKRGGAPITKFEKEILRTYLFQKLTGVL